MTATAKKQEHASTESHSFAAETAKVLQLMIHSLYTNKDIFLRELISNASDACDKLRYEALTNEKLLGDDKGLCITVTFDEKKKTVTISDNGIGMNREDLISNLGTIAKSGTQEFAAALAENDGNAESLIGQFGVGFYSSYMVANKVEVTTRKAGEDICWRWESDGAGEYTIAEAEERPRGTSITLHLTKENKEYLDPFRLRHIIETYSDHISFPIHLVYTDKDGNDHDDAVNQSSALWTRSKSEITEEQYQEFYRHVAHQPDEPWLTMHNRLEGRIEYAYLLYIPTMKPFDLFHPERQRRVKLYVKRVFITDENIDLVPAYMRFLRGIIDSADLPLNISRETLQKNAVLDKIRESITKKVLSELKKKAKKEPENYAEFWHNFGAVLKEGLCEAVAPKEQILECCLFESSKPVIARSDSDSGEGEERPLSESEIPVSPNGRDSMTTLDDYLSRMKDNQEHIYFLAGENLESLRNSPQIEGFKKQGIEVLFFTDGVDDFWTQTTREFKGKQFKSVTRASEDLKKLSGEAAKDEKADEKKADSVSTEKVIAYFKDTLGELVRDVRTTDRLDESPVCLAIEEGDMELRMERFLIENKQLPQGRAKLLEINADHAIIQSIAAKLEGGTAADNEADLVRLLFDQALIQEGEILPDPSGFSKRMNRFLVG